MTAAELSTISASQVTDSDIELEVMVADTGLDENQAYAVKEGGVEAVVRVIHNHVQTPSVVLDACWAAAIFSGTGTISIMITSSS